MTASEGPVACPWRPLYYEAWSGVTWAFKAEIGRMIRPDFSQPMLRSGASRLPQLRPRVGSLITRVRSLKVAVAQSEDDFATAKQSSAGSVVYFTASEWPAHFALSSL